MNTLTKQTADLDLLLEDILLESGAELLRVDPHLIVQLGSARTRDGTWPESTREGAETELVRVHCSELAFLLREGARRCEHWSTAEAAAWRTLVDEALAQARADDLDLSDLTPVWLPARTDAGLDAASLARASLSLAEHPLGRLELGRALQRQSQPQAASGVLAAALHGLAHLPGVLQARPWPELLRGLARAQECSGHLRRARLLRRWLPGRVA